MTATPPDPNQPYQPYGAYQGGPAGPPRQAPPAPPQPPSIALAVKLMWAGAVLSVLTLVYSFITMGDLKDEIEAELLKNDLSVDQATIDAVYGVSIAAVIVFGLVGALLWAWMAWKNGQGRGWARIVATVFGAFNLLGLLFTLLGAAAADPLATISSVVSVLLSVVILILLWRKESSAFYEGTAASKRLY